MAQSCGCTPFATAPTSSVRVRAGGDLQAAINAAQPGSEIVLDAGASYTGNYKLPVKSGTSYITIRTYGTTASCDRVTPAEAASLAKIVARGSAPAFTTATGAHHFRLVNLEIKPQTGIYNAGLVQLGSGLETQTSQLPHDLILDRIYLHGDPTVGAKRGVVLNSGTTTIQNSYIWDIKSTTQDSQAIGGWNGTGGWVIANNYLSAAGENILIGGTDPKIPNLIPNNIKVQFNHLDKPLKWRIGDPSYAGTHWLVKNLFELKNAQNVTIEGNLIEHVWPDAQKGFAVLFTPRNQDGTASWTRVSSISFRRNVVRHVAAAVNILGHDDLAKSQLTQYITVRDNLFDDVGGNWGGTSPVAGRLFQLLSGTNDPGPSNVTIDHNTGIETVYPLVAGGGSGAVAKPAFVFTNQIVLGGKGVYGDGASSTATAFSTNFPGSSVMANAVVGGSQSGYPSGNYYPTTSTVGWVGGGDYSLKTTSPYHNKGTDGRDLGADHSLLDEASQCQ
jgi:hypothetical protein